VAPDQSRLRRQLRGDLDNIVLKAMHSEPGRRYPSVEQLALDIARHLEGRPVGARKDTVGYRTAKFVWRNLVATGVAALLLITLIAGIVLSSWLAQKARVQERIAKTEQARAERRYNEVRQLARSVLFDYHDAIKDLPGATPVRARLVRDALIYLDSLAKEAQGDRSLQRELASAYVRVGDVQGGTMSANLGDTAGAITSYRKALQLDEAAFAADPGNRETWRDLAFVEEKLGLMLWETGDVAAARGSMQRTLALFESLVAAAPSSSELRRALARSHDRLGMLSQETGDTAWALEHYNRARETSEALTQADPGNPVLRRALSVVDEHTGTLLLLTGDLERALTFNAQSARVALAAGRRVSIERGFSARADGELLQRW
jgi:non-specific serine/threonine protein kinase/serine/threonine-protein kinase